MSDVLESSQTLAHRPRRHLLAALAVVVVVSGGYIGWHCRAAPNAAAAPAAASQPAIPVTVAAAVRRDVPIDDGRGGYRQQLADSILIPFS
jgi:hypothetical protein